MPCNAHSDSPPLQGGCRGLLLLVGLGAVAVALGLGLPFMLADTPPSAETLWARHAQGAIATTAAEAPAAKPARNASAGRKG